MSWELHLGDCLEGLAKLPDKSVDHVITDPPYSDWVHSKSLRGATKWKGTIAETRDFGFEHLTSEVMTKSSVEFARLAKRWTLVFCDVESVSAWIGSLAAAGLRYARTGAWIKVGSAPQFSGDKPSAAFETIVMAHAPGRRRWNGGGKAGIWKVPIVLDRGDGESRVHTAQKPLALMEALIRDFTDPGETILDPFAGSGTTGVACIRNGRNFIGWEKSEQYYKIAKRRLENTREQLRMFG